MGRSIFPNPEVVFSNCNFPITISVARTLTGFSVRVPRMTSVTGDVPYISRGEEPSVAVIGAGAAGLAAGRLLRDEGLRVTIFEKSRHLGGVWRYDPSPEAKAPMYRSLVTNLPKESMSFFGLPFPSEVASFPTHGQVQDYLCSFAEQYEITPLIKFGCAVESIRPVEKPTAADENGCGRAGVLGAWEVGYSFDTAGSGEGESEGVAFGDASASRTGDSTSFFVGETEMFDAVCVCNGHFDASFTPATEGFSGFNGVSIHARCYDRPDVAAFVGRRVLCVGSRSSGTDIAREVSSVASVVHVCDRKASASTLGGERSNVWWRPGLDKFVDENGVRFKDGTVVEVDTVVWCTGYNYSFPFLEKSGLLTPPVTERVHPLYEQLFHVHHPSLSFIGLPQSVVPFPLFELQANAVAAVLSGRVSLPRREDRELWLSDEDTALRERGVDPSSRGVHVLGARQWAYWQRLLDIAGGRGLMTQAPKHDAIRKNGLLSEYSAAAAAATTGYDDGDAEDFYASLTMRQAIYEDAGRSRPTFPGGPDDYRRRLYHVDSTTGTFSVSWADRKANGEGPSLEKPADPGAE